MTKNVLLVAALELEQQAERLRAMVPELLLPCEDYTLHEALAKVRAVVGHKGYVSVSPPTLHWHGRDEEVKADDWNVYDGTTHHNGATLTAAVNACLAAHAEPDEDPVGTVQATLAAAREPAF